MPTIRPKAPSTPMSTPAVRERTGDAPKTPADTAPASTFSTGTSRPKDVNALTADSIAAFAGRASAAGPIVGDAKLEKEPLRTYELQARGGAKEVATRASGARDAKLPPETKYKPVSEKQLAARIEKARVARTKDLKDGKIDVAPRAMPEDGSLTVKAMHMAVLGADQTGIGFQMQMAKIGEVEGFRVVLRVGDYSVDSMKRELAEANLQNVTLLPIKDPAEEDFWSEDQGELHVDGSVSVPRHTRGDDAVPYSEMRIAVLNDRVRRLHPRAELPGRDDAKLQAAARKFPDLGFSNIGAVGERNGQRAIAALGEGADRPVRINASYIEGGNMLLGSKGGEPYAVVGKDSVAVTRMALEKDLGRQVSEEEALSFIAADFGAARAIPVEQAGEFHIDMKMSLLPDGKVLLNDAKEAFKLQKQWLQDDHEKAKPKETAKDYKEKLAEWKDDGKALKERLAQMESRAVKDAQAEALAAKDLQDAGLSVHRVAGIFTTPYGQEMNFLNSERGMNAKGESFMIALGGDARAERYFVDKLMNDVPSGLSRIHFLDRELTGPTLQAMGGISCRTKLEGDVIG